MTKLSRYVLLSVLSLFCTIYTSHAGLNPFSWLKKKGPKRAETLVITGNYVKSRLLGELIQFKSEQTPVIIADR